MRRFVLTIILTVTAVTGMNAQSGIVKDFMPSCDSLNVLIQERHGIVTPRLRLSAVMKRGNNLDFYFTHTLLEVPWREGDNQWFRRQLKSLFPEKYSTYTLGQIYTKKQTINKLACPALGFDGSPSDSPRRVSDPSRRAIVTGQDAMLFDKGLSGRHIAVWQSHGRYYDVGGEKWEWQRPPLFQTVEDMFTQSFVLPYLVPMLENAGAYVMLPRERDIQTNEVIADNDPSCGARGNAKYTEDGRWSDAGSGFADAKDIYVDIENPFTMGTARKAECVPAEKKRNSSVIQWTPSIPQRGEYAVYVSYKTLENSTSAANYTVRHLGGESRFVVNQKMGGGTWIYLGTFEFDEGDSGYVSLSSATPDGYKHKNGTVVTADAVRFGGGMGNIARSGELSEPSVSGMARSAEGARYWLQWAGVSDKIYSQNDGENDYNDDYMSRGDWVEWISRGSDMNPSKKGGLGIPMDLSLGFHSDAGVTPNDSIIGTLAIYTLRSEGTERLPNKESRYGSRELADLVQSQITHDIRSDFEPQWSRRWIWDRSYREARTPSCPAMLLELLSHQNFADMKYGLDPSFCFTVGRSIYKGMLKYLSNRYGRPYIVQPLPVESVGVKFDGTYQAEISWTPRYDEIEPTAKPQGYILYTRLDDGAFDNGRILDSVTESCGRFSVKTAIKPGHIYSYRIAAYNEGGRSFASETVSIGTPSEGKSDRKVLIVNNFDRVSGPSFVDTPEYAGFDNRLDSGVPYMRDIAYIGDMYQFRRDMEWLSNSNPGFGGSYSDRAGEIIAGNTFDYAYTHGKAIIESGYPFYSCCNQTFCSDSTFRKAAWSADIICGKQVTVTIGSGSSEQKYTVFTMEMQDALRAFTSAGGNVLVSGANIATDIWDQVYPVRTDSTFREDSKKFAKTVLGYRWGTGFGSRRAEVRPAANKVFARIEDSRFSFYNEKNSICYSVENPDGLIPASQSGAIIMRYTDTNVPAAICHQGAGYRTACFGFPLETLKDSGHMTNLISSTLEYFSK